MVMLIVTKMTPRYDSVNMYKSISFYISEQHGLDFQLSDIYFFYVGLCTKNMSAPDLHALVQVL